MGDRLQDPVRQFIKDQIGSVVGLQLLLLLQAAPQHRWTADEARCALYLSDDSVALDKLHALAAQGLLARSDLPEHSFCYGPVTPELQSMAEHVNELFEKRRVTVIRSIYS